MPLTALTPRLIIYQLPPSSHFRAIMGRGTLTYRSFAAGYPDPTPPAPNAISTFCAHSPSAVRSGRSPLAHLADKSTELCWTQVTVDPGKDWNGNDHIAQDAAQVVKGVDSNWAEAH